MEEAKLILLMTHGSFCEAILESTEMIVGKLENARAFPLLAGVSPEEYTKLVGEYLGQNGGAAYILTDIRGGTPCNAACALRREYDVEVFSGLNMAMLIALDDLRRQPKEAAEVANDLLSAATGSIHHLN